MLSVELHVHLVEMPAPVAQAPHLADSLTTDVSREHRPEPVPPMPHRCMADIDPALEQQIHHIS